MFTEAAAIITAAKRAAEVLAVAGLRHTTIYLHVTPDVATEVARLTGSPLTFSTPYESSVDRKKVRNRQVAIRVNGVVAEFLSSEPAPAESAEVAQ